MSSVCCEKLFAATYIVMRIWISTLASLRRCQLSRASPWSSDSILDIQLPWLGMARPYVSLPKGSVCSTCDGQHGRELSVSHVPVVQQHQAAGQWRQVTEGQS
jgi:hypothetical protein